MHPAPSLACAQRWRLQQGFAAWRARAASCRAGRALLERMASQAQGRLVGAAFSAWRQFVPQQAARVALLSALLAARRRREALQRALAVWREAVDAKHGRRMQLEHARHVLAHLRQRHALQAWRAWREHRAARQAAWAALLAGVQQRTLQRAFAAWREELAFRRERREALMRWAGQGEKEWKVCASAWLQQNTGRKGPGSIEKSAPLAELRVPCQQPPALHPAITLLGVRRPPLSLCPLLCRFVSERALNMTQQAFVLWRAYTAHKREQAYALQQCVVRFSHRLLATGWAAWQQAVADAKVQRHRIAVCQRRAQAATLRAVLGEWRSWLARRRAQEMIVQLGHKRSDRNR